MSLPHDGGALLRGPRLITIDNGTLTASDLNGQTQLRRRLLADASLDEVTADLVLYTTDKRLHLFRPGDGRDIPLQLPDQISQASAQFDDAGGIVVGYDTADQLAGRIAYLQPDGVAALLAAGS